MASIDTIFSIILKEANEAGLEAILPYEGTRIWANAWGSLYISKEGDFGNIMKNALSVKNENYSDVANSFETNPIGNLSVISAGLRLTTGERMLLNKASVDLLTKAQELREKGDKLMLEALDRTETQKRLDGIWSAQLFRNTLANIKI
jgi:hypothetical protein